MSTFLSNLHPGYVIGMSQHADEVKFDYFDPILHEDFFFCHFKISALVSQFSPKISL